MARTANEGLARVLGPDHPDTLDSRNNLAMAYLDADRVDEAIAAFEENVKLEETKLGPDHPERSTSRNNLAAAYLEAGRTAEAISAARGHARAAGVETRARPPGHDLQPR